MESKMRDLEAEEEGGKLHFLPHFHEGAHGMKAHAYKNAVMNEGGWGLGGL